jgi:hypothetical protein
VNANGRQIDIGKSILKNWRWEIMIEWIGVLILGYVLICGLLFLIWIISIAIKILLDL